MVVSIQKAALFVDEGHLGGGGAGVDAQPGGAGVSGGVHLGGPGGVVPGQEFVILLLGVEEGGHDVHQGGVVHRVLQVLEEVIEVPGLVVGGAQGGADGGEAVSVFREDGVVPIQLECVYKALPQAHEEVEGAAQEDDLALELPALGQAGHGLVHHGLEDGGGHVLLVGALVEQGLDIGLGKDAAAGGNGVELLMLEGEPVQLVDGHVHEGGHLVDEGAGAAGAGAVHALLQSAAEEDDLGVLAAQLNDGVGFGYVAVHGGGGGVDLLDEVDASRLGHPQTGRAGDGQADRFAREHVRDLMQGLAGPLPGLGIVPLVGAEQKLVVFIQHHDLDSGGADVNTNSKTHRCTSLVCHGHNFVLSIVLQIDRIYNRKTGNKA